MDDKKITMLNEISKYEQMGVKQPQAVSIHSSIEEITYVHQIMRSKSDEIVLQNKLNLMAFMTVKMLDHIEPNWLQLAKEEYDKSRKD